MSEQELRDVLRLFREFTLKNATQWKLGANHHHPIWGKVAVALGDDNHKPLSPEEHESVYLP